MSTVREALASSRLDGETFVMPEALPTRAISLHAPWAWALMRGKDVENRSRGFPKTVTGRVWVHASLGSTGFKGSYAQLKSPTARKCFIHDVELMAETLWESLGWAHPGDETYRVDDHDLIGGLLDKTTERFGPDLVGQCDALRGHIVGSIEVTGYRFPDDPPDSAWYVPGSLAIMVRGPRPLAKPVVCGGALGWWTVPEAILTQLKGAA